MQMSAMLSMKADELTEEANFLVAFHERFHYLQFIFTPYGHHKWGINRSAVSDIVNTWIGEKDSNLSRKVPAYTAIDDGDNNNVKVIAQIAMLDFAWRFSDLLEGLNLFQDEWDLLGMDSEDAAPVIECMECSHRLQGVDIIECFAKFEEALAGYLFFGKELYESIDPDRLDPRYYLALYYFLDQVGLDRLHEFPVVCELALSPVHLLSPLGKLSYKENHPAWRFVRIVDYLKTTRPILDLDSDESFIRYCDLVLSACGYGKIQECWQSVLEYANSSDLSMSQEMVRAIEYKRSHPRCLSYLFWDKETFTSNELGSFQPNFVITENVVLYNFEKLNPTELMLENEMQALALQIIGRPSKHTIYPKSLLCADAYFGIKECGYYRDGSCSGHLTADSIIPKTVLDDNKNIVEGCPLEMVLNTLGTSIGEIEVEKIARKSFKEIGDKLIALRNN